MLTVTNIGNTFDDLLAVNAARVSFGKRHDSFDPEKDTKLINFLAKHDHWSPLAHPHATVKLYFIRSDTLERLIQQPDVMAGLTLRKGEDDNLWCITGSVWALLKLSYVVPNHHLYWHIAKHCPAIATAFTDKYPAPFKMDDAKTHTVQEFITDDDTFTFHIKAPVFVARQLVKHQQKLVWNEVSRRYVDYEPEFYDPKKMPTILQENSGLVEPDGRWENLCGWRGKAANKKQGSSDELVDMLHDHEGYGKESDVSQDIVEHNYSSLSWYKMLQNNLQVCPEQARMVLPQSMITEWYWSGTREAFQRVVDLRLKPDAQLETAYIAAQIKAYLDD